MEQSINQLWNFIFWSMAIIIGALGGILTWTWWIVGQLHQKATYKWIEEIFSKDIKNEIKTMNDFLYKIHSCLAGDLEKDGVVTRITSVEKEISDIKNMLKKME